MSIKVVLVDDHLIVRAGLCALLEKFEDIKVVGEAANGRKAIKLVRELSPDVVVIDVALPELNGIEATQRIIAEFPKVKVVALSMHSDKIFVTGMLKAGATGYLLKGCSIEELTNAIYTVTSNKAYLSPSISNIVINSFVSRSLSNNHSFPAALTSREREILQLIAEGYHTKEIASSLNLSMKTIETHRYHIMKKLDLHTVAKLTKYAIREGLTSL